jgi:hypothetical protein
MSRADEIAPDIAAPDRELPPVEAMSDAQIRARFGRITFRELRALPAEYQERIAQVVAPRVGRHLVEALRPAAEPSPRPAPDAAAEETPADPLVVRFGKLPPPPPPPPPPTTELDVSAVLEALAKREATRRRTGRKRWAVRVAAVAGLEAAGIGTAVPLVQLTPLVTAELSATAIAVLAFVALPWGGPGRRRAAEDG